MRLERNAEGASLHDIGALAAEAEAEGYDGLVTFEATRDPFVPLFLAAEHTQRLELTTAVAVAFARNPMTTASIAHDLQAFSGGRFSLGLGPQIKTHIKWRFSMPSDKPAARMREFVLAVRAIWDCWNHGTELDFRGDFYTHTLMPPLFRLDPCPQGPPPIVLAGVGPLMTETAGEVGDGYIAHGFTTGDYLREVTLPRLARGRERAGRTLEGFDTRGLALVATGHTEEQLERSVAEVREWLSFYGSTPAYAPVLEHHGWGDLHAELHRLSRSDGWAAMPALIDDEVLRTLAFVGEPREIGQQVLARYGDVFTRMSFYRPSEYVPEVWADVLDGFRTAQSAPAR